MNYTYLLLHPNANIIIDYIFELLGKNEFLVKAVYRIPQWDEMLDEIYKNTYPKADTIKMHVHAHAYINKYMFGNYGLILLLYKDTTYEELIKETLEVKRKIRYFMNKTKDGTISILLDGERFINSSSNIQKNIEEASKDFLKEDVKRTGKLINIFFSYVHCPDTVEQYEEDFKALENYMVNKLKPHEIDAVLKYRSFF